jgi:hypothetical protein
MNVKMIEVNKTLVDTFSNDVELVQNRPEHSFRSVKTTAFGGSINWFWEIIFSTVDPLRLTIVAGPRTQALLISRMLFVADEGDFRPGDHVLSLSREETGRKDILTAPHGRLSEGKDSPEASESTEGARTASFTCHHGIKPTPCNLFTIRPWDHLLLNEGSSIPVYKTYEWFHRRPPSILGALLGVEEHPNDEPLFPSTVRSMAYVGIFPLSPHFRTLVRHLPRLDKLFVQLVPRGNILDDEEVTKNVDRRDLWLERNSSYRDLMDHMLGPQEGNWAHLKEFESGDAADRDAWQMAMEQMYLNGRGWRVAGDGVFIKRGPNETVTIRNEYTDSTTLGGLTLTELNQRLDEVEDEASSDDDASLL